MKAIRKPEPFKAMKRKPVRHRHSWTILLITMASASQVMKPHQNLRMQIVQPVAGAPAPAPQPGQSARLAAVDPSKPMVQLSWDPVPGFEPDSYTIRYSDDLKNWHEENIPASQTTTLSGGRITTTWGNIASGGKEFFQPTVMGNKTN